MRPQISLITAMQGGLTLELARQHQPDLIVLDLHLPDLSGDTVLRRLRRDARTAHIPVVIFSADATERQVKRLMAAGARALSHQAREGGRVPEHARRRVRTDARPRGLRDEGRRGGGIEFAVLAEADDGPPAEHLTEAERIYGGPLRFPDARRPYLYGNFVSSIDGVVSVGLADGTDSSTISGRDAADRFLMALLRGLRCGAHRRGHAACDAGSSVDVPGSVSRRPEPPGRVPGFAGPDRRGSAGDCERQRRSSRPRGASQPRDAGDRADHGAGAERARKLGLPFASSQWLGPGAIDGAAIVAALEREMDATHVLCEGGPSLMGTLVRARSLSELFITVSPRLAGRDGVRERRGLIDGWAPGPDSLVRATLLSVRRSGDHVLLRYSLS